MNDIKYLKEKKEEINYLSNKINKLKKNNDSISIQLKKFERRSNDIIKQLDKDKTILKSLNNYSKILKQKRLICFFKIISLSLITTSSTMLLEIISNNILAGIPIYASLISFSMIEIMIYYYDIKDLKIIKKNTDMRELNKKIIEFEKTKEDNLDKLNTITEIKNSFFNKIIINEEKLNIIKENINEKIN